MDLKLEKYLPKVNVVVDTYPQHQQLPVAEEQQSMERQNFSAHPGITR